MFIHLENRVIPPLRGPPDNRPTPLKRPIVNVNLLINVLISTPYVTAHQRKMLNKLTCTAKSRVKPHFWCKGWLHKRGFTVTMVICKSI